MDWYKQTPSGQYTLSEMAKLAQQGTVGNLKAVAEGVNAPFQLASQTPIPGTGKLTGGTDVSAGEIAQPAFTLANRVLNPFNPDSIWRNKETFQTPSVVANAAALSNPQQFTNAKDALLNQPDTTVANAVGGWLKDTYSAQLNKFVAFNKYL